MWRKQNFWIGRIETVNWENRTVFHIWDDNDRDTLSFDEIFVYPTTKQTEELRNRLRNGVLNQNEKIFASRTHLGTKCGPVSDI